MDWKRPVTQPLNIRRGLTAGLAMSAASLIGYLGQGPHPTAAGATEVLVATLFATFAMAALAARTNRELRRCSRDHRA